MMRRGRREREQDCGCERSRLTRPGNTRTGTCLFDVVSVTRVFADFFGLFGCVYVRGTWGYRHANKKTWRRIESACFFFSLAMTRRYVFVLFWWGELGLATPARKHTRILYRGEEKRTIAVAIAKFQ